MSEKIYGVDLSEEITPIKVRDAIVKCFGEAHAEVLELMEDYYKFSSKKEFEKIKQLNVEFVIKSKFEEVGANFEKPTKEELVHVMDKLAELAVNFRDPKIVKEHYNEIMRLVERL